MYMRIALVVLATGALITGCSGGKTKGPSARRASPHVTPQAKPLTEVQARAIFERSERVNNEANAKVSDPLLRSNEIGPMLEVDLAGNKRIRSKKQKKISPFFHANTRFFIPRNANPAWFGVLGSVGKDTEIQIMLDTGGGVYKNVLGCWLGAGQKVPAIARDADGFATAVTTGTTVGVSTKIAAYLTAVAAGKHAPGGIKSGRLTSRVGKSWARSVARINAGHRWSGSVTWTARPDSVYALKTADGGAVVFDAETETENYTATQPNVWFEPDSRYFGLGPKRYFVNFSGELVWQHATYVPSQGPASVLADSANATRATGS